MATIQNVSDTALWVAHYRAVESQRPDAVFRDSLAAKLVGDRGAQIARNMPRGGFTKWMMVPRTTLIDRYVYEAVADGVDTIINLGAGLDTRPYRMNLPASLQWIEADFSHMIEYKNEMLREEKPTCKLRRAAVDLGNAGERRKFLQEAVFGSKKAAVITEGVIIYLTNEQASDLANDLHQQSAIVFWIQDWVTAKSLEFMRKRRAKVMKNAPFRFAPDEWFSFFENRGWKLKELATLHDESKRLGRRPTLPTFALTVLTFISAKAREIIRKATGCAVLMRK